MQESIFRKKSMEQLSSPEQLNDYLRVTNPFVWAVLFAVIIVLAGLFFWSYQAAIVSYASGTAVAKDHTLTISFTDETAAQHVDAGMEVEVGEAFCTVSYIGLDNSGNKIAVVENANIPDGVYEAKVGYRQTQIMKLLFN